MCYRGRESKKGAAASGRRRLVAGMSLSNKGTPLRHRCRCILEGGTLAQGGGGGCGGGGGGLVGSLSFGGWRQTFRPRSPSLPDGFLDGAKEGSVMHSAGLRYVRLCCGFDTEDGVARFRAIFLTSKEVIGDETHLILPKDILEQGFQFGGAHGVRCPGFR